MIRGPDGGVLVIVVVFVLAYLAGAVGVAFWIDRRWSRLAPRELRGAVVHLFAAGVSNQLLDGPLAGLAARSLPAGPVVAVMGVVFPLVVYVCLAAIWMLRIAQRALSGRLP
jgi:hypothetical protein